MPNLTPIQRSFSAGEISPRMLARADMSGYNQSCDTLENFIALAHGPIRRRGGFQYVAQSDQINLAQVRLIPFQVSQTESYVLLVGDEVTVVYTRYGGQGTENFVENGLFDDGLTGWDAVTLTVGTGLVQVVFGQCVLIPGNPANDDAGIQQEVTGLTDGENYILRFQLSGAPGGPGVNIRAGFTEGSGEIIPEQKIQPVDQDIEFTADATGTMWIAVWADGGDPQYLVDNVRVVHVDNASTFVVIDTPWAVTDNLDLLHWEAVPSTNEVFFTHPNYAPYEITYNNPHDWPSQDIELANAPAEWVDRNWPATITFFQGRSWWAATPARGETVWSSKSGEIRDLDPGTAEPAEGIEYTLNIKGRISWLRGAKDFLIGTENGEHIVTADAGVITPDDITVTQQSAYGSNTAQAEQLGNRVLYISPDEGKIRAMKYEFVDAGWSALDITFPSEHIAFGRMRALDFAQHPENQIWSVDRLGRLIACTYEQTNQIVGWHRHVTQGAYLSACVTEENGYSQLWVASRRLIEDEQIVFLERYDPIHFMDAHTHHVFATPTTIVTGLEYLEGRTVQVLVDEAVHPDRVVIGGQIELQLAGTIIDVGLGYTSFFRSLPLDEDIAEGSMTPYMKHWNKIYVRLLNSAMPLINGHRPPDRTPATPMNTREPNITEDIRVANLGHSRRAVVEIVQDLPLPCTVLGLFGELSSEKL